jgi:hypothetical protein
MERFRPLALAEPPLWLKPTWDVASNILLPQPRPAAAAPLGRIGSLEVRLAETRKEIKLGHLMGLYLFLVLV